MASISIPNKSLTRSGIIVLCALFAFFSQISEARAEKIVKNDSGFGTIRGVIRDEGGKPIANAVVAFFKPGVDEIFEIAKSNSKGNYLTRIIPGTYMIIAAAKGFSAVTIPEVQVNRSTELNYGFNLVRVGSGNTLPEKTIDRNSSKWRIRAAQSSRSIYQNGEGDVPVDENTIAADDSVSDESSNSLKRRAQSVVETYFSSSSEGGYTGLNFATLQPLGENSEITFIGQTGSRSFAPNRFETAVQTRPNDNHQIRVSASVSKIGQIKIDDFEKQLGQVSFQASDQWKIREGVIVVLGVDYSRFFGAGDDSSITPRLGLQYDINSRTRIKSAFTTQTEEKTWAEAIEFEGSQVLFRQQFEPKSISIEEGKPQMNKSRRLEFGVERILSNNSSIEATAFFDSVTGRGVGLAAFPVSALSAENFSQIDATQQGRAEGIRVVYSHRLNGTFSTSAGYSFGTGQRISASGFANPNEVFENGVFQTFVGQINTDLKTGTSVQTIFRLSPQATIFAIDPFQGRLAIYDPSLSILVTQPLPNWGLPIRATAVIDARNLLDFQTGSTSDEGSLLLNSPRRVLRGGISVRF